MSKYTTGDMAKLCEISIRTVQFYDIKELLKPTDLTEGGRRLYSEDDLKKLRTICLLKSLGLSLDSIRGIMDSKNPGKILLLLLEQQLKSLDTKIADMQKQKDAIEAIKKSIRDTKAISVNSINDIEKIMSEKKKLRKVHGIMLIVGIVMDIIEIATIVLWAVKGIWLPFAVGMPIVILLGILMTRMYYKNTAYICPECSANFRPKLKEFLFAKHTPKTRKLKCTTCGYEGYCVEKYADEKTFKSK